MKTVAALLFFALFGGVGLFIYDLRNKQDMTLYFYPEAPSLHEKVVQEVEDVEECRYVAESLSVRYDRPNYDYECGISCEPSGFEDGHICDKTIE